jgi:hypothetical protein
MSIKTKLRERGLKPFKELAKHGDIRAISRKIGGFIFEYGVGVPFDVGFSLACLTVSSILGFFDNEETNKEKRVEPSQSNVIDYSTKKFIPILKIVNLDNETLPIGTKQDIELFFGTGKTFTEPELENKYKDARKKYHPDRMTGDREKWDECEKLYNEMIWHFFRTNEEKILNPNYPKLRGKSFRFTPKFALNQMIYFDNNIGLVYGRVARQASCNLDDYLIINDDLELSYEVKEKDLKLAENIK